MTSVDALSRGIRLGLDLDLVVVEPAKDEADRRSAAVRGAARHLDASHPARIGVGWGMSLRQLPQAVPVSRRPGVQVYEAVGRGTWWAPEDGPFDIAAELAARYGGRAWHVSAPVFADSATAARAFLADPTVARVLAAAASSDVVLVGPSTADPDTSSLVLAGGLTRDDLSALRTRGVVGDVIGQFYDVAGHPIETALDARSVRLSLGQLRAANVVAIAAGRERLRSIVGAARCGLIKGLVTDDRTASELIEVIEAIG